MANSLQVSSTRATPARPFDLDAATFEAEGGQQIETDVLVLDRPHRSAAAGLIAAGSPDRDLLDLIIARRARITWRPAFLAFAWKRQGEKQCAADHGDVPAHDVAAPLRFLPDAAGCAAGAVP